MSKSARTILIKGRMRDATSEGRKTQVRFEIKLPHSNPLGVWEPTIVGGENGGRTRTGQTIPLQGAIWHTRTGDSLLCPNGAPGDRLLVRASRYGRRGADQLSIDVVNVRVERLLDISDADCMAEGIERYRGPLRWVKYLDASTGEATFNTAREAYLAHWESEYGAGSVDRNPFVWVIDFKRVLADAAAPVSLAAGAGRETHPSTN